MRRIKFAVVGCGSIGARHVAVLDAEPQAEIVALCDIEEIKFGGLSELYGNIPTYRDYGQMLKHVNADVVNICTPHNLHAAMTLEAAHAGMHILVEKPMALTQADAQEMIEAARVHNINLMVVKQNRYNVPVVITKKAIEAGHLGKIFMVRCDVLWNRHDQYYAGSHWRGRKESEGGALYTQASHFIDLLNWWFGDVVEASSSLDTKNHDIEIEDCGCATLAFENGVIGSLMWTTCVYNKNYEGSITIIGEKGTIKIGGQYLNKIEYWDVQAYPLPESINFVDKPNLYGRYQGTSSNHDKVIKDVISHVLNGNSGVATGDDGIRSVSAIEMIYKSAR